MIISETPYSKRIVKKINEDTVELVDVYDLSHPECPIVLIGGSAEVLHGMINQQSEELKEIE